MREHVRPLRVREERDAADLRLEVRSVRRHERDKTSVAADVVFGLFVVEDGVEKDALRYSMHG